MSQWKDGFLAKEFAGRRVLVTGSSRGIGAAVAAVVVRAHHPGTFQVLFLANGLSCLLFAVLLPALPNLRRTRVVNETRVGYRYVLSHRGLRLMILASLLLAFTGPAAFDTGVPAFASVAAHVSDHAIALSFTINTAVIVAIQMLVLRLVRRHPGLEITDVEPRYWPWAKPIMKIPGLRELVQEMRVGLEQVARAEARKVPAPRVRETLLEQIANRPASNPPLTFPAFVPEIAPAPTVPFRLPANLFWAPWAAAAAFALLTAIFFYLS